MEWQSKQRQVPARPREPLGRAFIQYLLLLLVNLLHRYEQHKVKALASMRRSLEKQKSQLQGDPLRTAAETADTFRHPCSTMVTMEHGTRALVAAPIHVRLQTFAQVKALIGELAKCSFRLLEVNRLS